MATRFSLVFDDGDPYFGVPWRVRAYPRMASTASSRPVAGRDGFAALCPHGLLILLAAKLGFLLVDSFLAFRPAPNPAGA